MIVTVTPTILDGTVVRWFPDMPLSQISAVDAIVTASRNGVRVHSYLDQVEPEPLAAARDACELLRRDRDADVSHLATHTRRGLFGPYVRIESPAAAPASTE